MIDNSKYTSFMNVMSRVTSLVKNKQINPADILEWCIQCETEYIQHEKALVKYLQAPLKVRDKMARIPPLKVRILDVYSTIDDETSTVSYYDNGAYLILPSDYSKDTIYMNFYGLAMDTETGEPMIMKGHEEACLAHVLCNLYFEDYINGKMDQGRYMHLEDRRSVLVTEARSSLKHYGRKELREVLAVRLNLYPTIFIDTLHHKGIGD